jgi:predicted glycosyltransferase
MKIVVDINHPAHVHYFKNFIWEMERRGHEVLITATEKDVALKLLDNYGFDYINMGSYGNSLVKKLMNISVMNLKMYKALKSFKPDIFVGFGSIRAAHVSKLMRKTSITLEDTEHSKWENRLYLPFTDAVLTPSCFQGDLGKKHIRYNGYTELAHLHPNYFTPNPAVLDEIGLSKDDNIFLIRFAAFNASHDTKSEKLKKEYVLPLIKKLEKKGKIIISSEIKLDKDLTKYQYNLSPEKYHDVLYYSKMYVGESSTSAEEAAILGTPSLNFERIVIKGETYSFAEFSGILDELQNKYGLVHCFHNEGILLRKIDKLLEKGIEKTKKEWKEKREKMLKDKIDVTAFMVWFIENYPESFREMKENPEIQRRFK